MLHVFKHCVRVEHMTTNHTHLESALNDLLTQSTAVTTPYYRSDIISGSRLDSILQPFNSIKNIRRRRRIKAMFADEFGFPCELAVTHYNDAIRWTYNISRMCAECGTIVDRPTYLHLNHGVCAECVEGN